MATQPRRPSRIPDFASREEAAAFWDEHDLGEFENELEVVDLDVAESPGHVLSVRLEREAFRRLCAIARQRGVNIITMAETWVLEAIERAEADEFPETDRPASRA